MGNLIPSDLTTENIGRLGGIGVSLDGVERDNAPNAAPAGMGKTEANIVRLRTPAQCRVHAQGMQSEHLAEYVVTNGWGDVLVRLKQLKPYIEILWDRFDELKGTETIAGCRTKEEFCEKRLNRSIRAVQYMLYGRTPKKANSARSGKQPKAGQEEIVSDNSNDAIPPAEAADGATLGDPSMSGLVHGPKQTANGAAQPSEKSHLRDHDEEVEDKKIVRNVLDAPLRQPAGDRVPDPDPGVMEALRQRVNLMADTAEIAKALQEFFSGLIQPLLEQHPYGPSSTICVGVSRRGCSRIGEGDWVEYKGGDTQLTERAGRDKTLGRVVGMDNMGRPRIRWHNGQAWGKPYSLFHNYNASSLRVLFAFQAAERFPEAYGSYPADDGGAPGETSQKRTTSEHSVDPGTLKSGGEEGAGMPPETSPPDRGEQAMATVQAATPAAQQDAGPLGVANQDAPQPAAAPAPKQGMSEEAMRTPSKAAPEPPSGRAGVPTTGAARRRKMAKYEYPLSDLEIIEEWSKTNWGTAKDIVAQCPDLAEKRVKKVGEMCEQLVAEGRLKATDAPGLHYIGQAGAYFRELREKGVRSVWVGSGNSRQRVPI